MAVSLGLTSMPHHQMSAVSSDDLPVLIDHITVTKTFHMTLHTFELGHIQFVSSVYTSLKGTKP